MLKQAQVGNQAVVNQVPVAYLFPSIRYDATPALAALTGGGIVAVFDRDSQIVGRLVQATSTGLQATGTDFAISDPGAPADAFAPHVTPLPDGGFLAIWIDVGSLMGRAFNADGSPRTDATTIYQNDLSNGGMGAGPAFSASLTTLTDGSIVANYSLTRPNGDGSSTEQSVSALLTVIAGQPDLGVRTLTASASTPATVLPGDHGMVDSLVTADGEGFLRVQPFYGQDGSEALGLERMDASGVPSEAVPLAFDAVSPAAAILSDGNVVVAWQDTSSGGIDDEVFTPGLQSLGGIQQVSQTRTGIQTDPSIAAVSGNAFAITWSDDETGSAGAGLVTRIFSDAVGPLEPQHVVSAATTGDQTSSSSLAVPGTTLLATAWNSEGTDASTVEATLTAAVNADDAFYLSDLTRPQALNGTGPVNFVDTAGAAGTGDITIDLTSDTILRGGQADAGLSNVLGFQLGSERTVVLGDQDQYRSIEIYGGSGDLDFQAGLDSTTVQGGTGRNMIVASDRGPNTPGGPTVFYGNGGSDTMVGGSSTNTMVGGASPGSSDTFVGLQHRYVFDAASTEVDYIYGRGGTVVDYGGVGAQVLYAGSGTNTMVGTTHSFTEPLGIVSTGTNVFYGGTGSNAGTDLFYAGIGVNLLYEGSGKETFVGNTGTDHIVGGSGQSAIYGGSGNEYVDTGAGDQYLQAGTGNTVFNETAASLTAGRGDWIDGFKIAPGAGQPGTYINLPSAAKAGTTFQSLDGGTLILAPATDGAGQAGLFVSHTAVAQVQAQTFFV